MESPGREKFVPAPPAAAPPVTARGPASPVQRRPTLRARVWSLGVPVVAGVLAVGLFVFALRLLVISAGGLTDVLGWLGADGALNFVGFGWLGSYLVLSGSPVAATALTLHDAGVLSELEAFGQVVGSRMGASFVVLAVGFLYYLRGRRLPDSVHVGVVAFLVTISTYVPVALLGWAALRGGWFDGLDVGVITPLVSFTDSAYDPVLDPLADALPNLLLFVAGLFLLLAALRLFDSVLPTPEVTSNRLAQVPGALQTRGAMFGLGALVTLVTFSVAVSLTLLIPLALRGAIRRNAVVPYVLGANITTFVDTLFAASVLERADSSPIVLTTMIFALGVALLVLGPLYRPYYSGINRSSRWIMRDPRNVGWFVALLFAVPLVLLLV